MNNFKKVYKELDKSIVFFPFILVVGLCVLFFVFPESTNHIMDVIKPIFGDKLSLIYLVINFGMFIMAFVLSFSKYGNIVLGDKNEKPQFSFWAWGAMMFCCGLAGDILYYSFTEWVSYVQEPYIQSLGKSPYDMANCYSLFFWSNYWLYLVLAVCFAFMIHVRKVNRQKYSESLRPLFGKKTDGIIGKIIDVFSTFVIIAAVTCSLCFTIPIITSCLNKLFGIPNSKYVTIVILMIVCAIYSTSVFNGLKGIKFLSSICIYVFLVLIAYIFFFGGKMQFILESSFKQLGLLLDNLIPMFTDIDPTRQSTFVQDYCAFYDAYWLTWAITVPYFIAVISKGRTIKQTIMGGFLFAIPGGTLSYFIVPNFCMGKQILGEFDFINLYNTTGNMYEVITSALTQLPLYWIPLIIMIISMICFCATSFDSIALTCSYYSYKNISNDKEPNRFVRLFWAILLMLLPIAFTFADTSYENLQNVAVMAGFPASIIIILVLISFFKDANRYLEDMKNIRF